VRGGTAKFKTDTSSASKPPTLGALAAMAAMSGALGSTSMPSMPVSMSVSMPKAMPKAMATMTPSMQSMAGVQESTSAEEPGDQSAFRGLVQGWNPDKGHGFIQLPSAETDVFVNLEDCIGRSPSLGDMVYFDLVAEPIFRFSHKAKQVKGGSGPPLVAAMARVSIHAQQQAMNSYGKLKMPTALSGPYSAAAIAAIPQADPLNPVVPVPPGRICGTMTTWFTEKHYGFAAISGSDDVFVHKLQCRGGIEPKIGDVVEFQLEQSHKNNGKVNWTAKNVSAPGAWMGE